MALVGHGPGQGQLLSLLHLSLAPADRPLETRGLCSRVRCGTDKLPIGQPTSGPPRIPRRFSHFGLFSPGIASTSASPISSEGSCHQDSYKDEDPVQGLQPSDQLCHEQYEPRPLTPAFRGAPRSRGFPLAPVRGLRCQCQERWRKGQHAGCQVRESRRTCSCRSWSGELGVGQEKPTDMGKVTSSVITTH